MNGAATLLEQAISYAGRSVLDVTPALLPRPTPCRCWNLDMLLRHSSESLAALHEATATGHVALIPATPDRDPADPADPARTFRDRAARLLAARATAGRRHQVLEIGDLPLPAVAIDCAGAIEIAVHGWDISQACGQNRPIPDTLAAGLLAIAPLLIPETGRASLFSPPVAAIAQAGPGDRLVAYLGRKPTYSTACAGLSRIHVTAIQQAGTLERRSCSRAHFIGQCERSGKGTLALRRLYLSRRDAAPAWELVRITPLRAYRPATLWKIGALWKKGRRKPAPFLPSGPFLPRRPPRSPYI
ncbi:MAG TPA: TIGR03086 family metal-binding protein [Streptosporangiaceae bacterium]